MLGGGRLTSHDFLTGFSQLVRSHWKLDIGLQAFTGSLKKKTQIGGEKERHDMPHIPQDPCLIYLPRWMADVYLRSSRYTSPMDPICLEAKHD